MPRRKLKRHAYGTDQSNGQWALIASLIPEAEPDGRPGKASIRELIDAVLFFIRSGAAWRLVAHGRRTRRSARRPRSRHRRSAMG
ncbi:MAG: transposase [Janthinobacterium lividum]